jgi:condensation domain-containing protein
MDWSELQAPATKAQEKFWNLRKFDPSSNVDNIPLCVPLGSAKNPGNVRRALTELIHRHEALRTAFKLDGDMLLQLISATPAVSITTTRVFNDLGQACSDGDFIQQLRDIVQEPFDYAAGSLLRALHVRLRNSEDILLIVISHIIADGWSCTLIEREVREIAASLNAGGKGLDAPPVKQFRNIAVEQHDWRDSSRLRRQHDYWISKVADISPALSFPLLSSRDSISRETMGGVPLSVSPHGWHACRELALEKKVPLTIIPLTALVIALAEFSDSGHVLIGQIYSNRARGEDRSVVGLLSNGLPLRFDIGHNPEIGTLMREARSEVLRSIHNGEFPMEEIADETGYGRGVTGGLPPMWEVAVNLGYQDNPVAERRDDLRSCLLRVLNSSTRRGPKRCWDGKYLELRGLIGHASFASEVSYNADAVTGRDAGLLAERVSRIIESMPSLMGTLISKSG